jgi:hypothetical protein
MAINAGPDIVEDGLVLCLDAANINSYPKTGTTWSDLAGSNNGTLTNGPTFDAGNGGVIILDGTDDYVDCGDVSELNFTNNFTLSAWFKRDASQSAPDSAILAKATSSNSYAGYMVWYQGNTVKFYISGGVRATASVSLTAEVWYYVTCTYDGATAKVYLNKTLDTSASYSGTANAAGTPFYVGRYGYADREVGGDFGIVKAYNRALTAKEIRQNFEATVGRYS